MAVVTRHKRGSLGRKTGAFIFASGMIASMTTENETPEVDAAAETEVEKKPVHHRTRKTPAPKVEVENSVSPSVVAAPAQKATAVVGPGDTDEVWLSRLEFEAYAKKSLSVHHLQRRLNDLGYTEAFADKDGWYSKLTREAVAKFQIDRKIEPANGLVDAETAQAIFEGDPNVTLVLA